MTFKQRIAKAKILYKTGKYTRFSDAVAAVSKSTATKKPVKKAAKKIGYHINKTTFIDPTETGKKRKKNEKFYNVKRDSAGHFLSIKKATPKQGVMFSGVGSIHLHEIGSELLSLEFTIKELKHKKTLAKLAADKKKIQAHITILTGQFNTLKKYLNTRAKFV